MHTQKSVQAAMIPVVRAEFMPHPPCLAAHLPLAPLARPWVACVYQQVPDLPALCHFQGTVAANPHGWPPPAATAVQCPSAGITRSLSGEIEWILMQVRAGNLDDLRKLAEGRK
jgi:hypothetical protein